ncbi:MAG TPA: DNA-binding protein [Lentisphaeria bacterium]|nr:MAG: hypothetical protein A2X48_19160 [Lentisphaerae bacterium GWF2_49_21]HBC87261.1 DNA-binding protein [Lentisphaeria bacterium]
MNQIVAEWILKADGDFNTAAREMAATDNPNYDAVCFHSQQCIEKLLKAFLIKKNIIPPKIHDLAELCRMIEKTSHGWIPPPVNDLNFLSRAAVDFRYPGESADKEEAEGALTICSRLRPEIEKVINS